MAVQTLEDYKVLIVKMCNKYNLIIPELGVIENRHHAVNVMMGLCKEKKVKDSLLDNICLN